MPDFDYENRYKGRVVAGVDEAGRGPWAGPVVAAAVILDYSNFPEDLNDSKKLSKLKREEIFDKLINVCDYGVGVVSESIIDQVNILQATKLAMKSAIFDLFNKPEVMLVDGNQKLEIENIECLTIVKGDAKSLSIAAASIIAKVTRDKIMEDLGEEFPQYGWPNNSGYGTKQHQDALNKHGITKYHRKSFAPIKRIIEVING